MRYPSKDSAGLHALGPFGQEAAELCAASAGYYEEIREVRIIPGQPICVEDALGIGPGLYDLPGIPSF